MSFRLRVILSIILCLILTNLAFSTTEELEAIRAAIKAKGAEWTAGETWVSRLAPEEARKLLGAREPEIFEPISPPPGVMGYPLAIDWRNKDGHNWVTSIKNQEVCGSCVAFAAVATLEPLVRIELNQPNKEVDLSEMDVFNCGCGPYHNYCCCDIGWDNSSACYYLKNSGAPDEECWPYQPVDESCSNTCYNWQERAVRTTHYGYIYGEELCKTCVAITPILAQMDVYDDFEHYTGGIYKYTWDEDGYVNGYHAVCIVGYDTSGYTDYWICKNSWGTDWGENGFFKIKMGECRIETTACYWMSDAVLPSPPSAPSSLTANAISDTQVNLSWKDNSSNESRFEIQRKKAGGTFSTIASVGGDVTSYKDKNVSGEITYYYQVRAYNAGGNSTFSNTASVTTPPNAPSNLNASTLSSSRIRVTWRDNSNAESGFQIWQKKGSGSWQHNCTVGANVTSKDITGLQEGTTYYYRVRAYNSYGNSDWSNTDSANTLPNAPSNLNAFALSPSEIRVTWKDNSNKENGFEIWQKKGSGSWQLKCTVGANVTSKNITGLQEATTYCYRVRAYSSYGNSDWSNTDCDTTHSGVPAAPSNLKAYGYCFEVKLTWQDNSNNEDGFIIYRKTGANYIEFDRVGPNVTTYWDVDLWCGLTWCYGVRAFNESGNSPFSNTACAKTTACYYCEEGLGMKITTNRKNVTLGESVTYTYILKNKGRLDLTIIELSDDKFGIIAKEFTIKKGEAKSITKIAILNKTTTNFAKATAIFRLKDEIKHVKAHACTTVVVRNSSEK